MPRTQAKTHLSPLLMLSLLLATGCSNVKPLEGSPHADSIPEGPGLFTGKDGEMRFSIGNDGVKRERDDGAIAASSRSYGDQGGDEGQ